MQRGLEVDVLAGPSSRRGQPRHGGATHALVRPRRRVSMVGPWLFTKVSRIAWTAGTDAGTIRRHADPGGRVTQRGGVDRGGGRAHAPRPTEPRDCGRR